MVLKCFSEMFEPFPFEAVQAGRGFFMTWICLWRVAFVHANAVDLGDKSIKIVLERIYIAPLAYNDNYL